VRTRSVLTPALLAILGLAGVAALIVWQTAAPARDSSLAERAATRAPRPQNGGARHPTLSAGATTAPTSPDTPPLPSTTVPPSPAPVDAERAAALEIRDHVRAGRIGRARSLANAYYERFPSGPATADIGRLTGAHPTRDAPASSVPDPNR
jgi:hypothetical protein